jgi:hypothetical protein
MAVPMIGAEMLTGMAAVPGAIILAIITILTTTITPIQHQAFL